MDRPADESLADLVGLVLGITAVSTWLFVLPAELHGHIENPYKGVVLYLILPFVLVAGTCPDGGSESSLGRRRIRKRLETASWTAGRRCNG